jgi:hypothetical protein
MMIKGFDQFLTERSIGLSHINYYAFDIDDNIVHMSTRIHTEIRVGDKWVPNTVSTAEFRDIKNQPTWKQLNDPAKAYAEFRDDGPRGNEAFIEDLIEAIKKKNYGPVWDDFIECLTNGSLFALITARGHESPSIRKGIEWLIDYALTEDQQYQMYNNLAKFAYIFKSEGKFSKVLNGKPTDNKLVKKYLDNCEFIGVTAPSRGASADSFNPAYEKEKALMDFSRRVSKLAANVGAKARIGFSDDDNTTVKHITDLVETLGKGDLPDMMEFTIKNTNNIRRVTRTKKTIEGVDPLQQSTLSATKFGNMTSQLYPSSQDGRQDDFLNQHIKRTNHLAEVTKDMIEDRKKKKRNVVDTQKDIDDKKKSPKN